MDAQLPASAMDDAPSVEVDKTERQPPQAESSGDARSTGRRETIQADESSQGLSGGKQPKTAIDTLEHLIEHAYGRRGKALSLTPKIEKKIAQKAQLNDAEQSRLLQLAKRDVLLVVPRQLLLLSSGIDSSPALRLALISFVSNLMLRHSAFQDEGVQAVLRSIPEFDSAAEALLSVTAFTPPPGNGDEPPKGVELEALRHNAAQLFATWLAVNHGFNADELSSLLLQSVWLPAARELSDRNARLRALTEIEHAAGVGVACQRFRQQAIDARRHQDQAQREAMELNQRLAASEARLAETEEQRDALQTELLASRERFAAELEAILRQHAAEKTHLQHDLHQLRGRLVKRLTDSVDMLEVGLSALRKEPPRVLIMVERAEHVTDSLRAEIQGMSEE